MFFLVKIRNFVQSYYKLLKYKSFFEKKLQNCDFFCNFALVFDIFDQN